jgi:hypothetical protein
MKKPSDILYDKLRAEVERERRKSRRRNRISGERVHPVQHDIDRLCDFVIDRRATQPGALDALRRLYKSVDVEAMRFLTDIVLNEGRCDLAMRRRCARLSMYCDKFDRALSLEGRK